MEGSPLLSPVNTVVSQDFLANVDCTFLGLILDKTTALPTLLDHRRADRVQTAGRLTVRRSHRHIGDTANGSTPI